MAELFGTDAAQYPEVDPNDPRYNEVAKRPPNPDVLESWRFDDVIWEEPHWVTCPVSDGERVVNGEVLVIPHQLFKAECPDCGPTYIISTASPASWPRAGGQYENSWAVKLACGCTWCSGGMIGGGNRFAGWYKDVTKRPRKQVRRAPAAVPVPVAKTSVKLPAKVPVARPVPKVPVKPAPAAPKPKPGIWMGDDY